MKLRVLFLSIFAVDASARLFHVDPAAGAMANDGSPGSPWRTLPEVIAQNKVESRTAAGTPRNAGAPVKAGDTLLLRTGYHGVLSIRDYNNASPVTVMAQPGHTPRFASVSVGNGSARWVLKGLSVSPAFAPAFARQTLFSFGGSDLCVLDSSTGHSVADASGWSASDWNSLACDALNGGTRLTVRRCHFKNVNFGMETGAHGLLEHNTVENFAGDAVRCNGDSTVVQYNTLKNVYNVNDNHADGIQAWTTGPGGVGTGVIRGNVLRGNTIISREDPAQPFHSYLQGIGLFDGTYQDWIIENNVVITDHPHGIAIYGAAGCRVVNNTVVDVSEASRRPWVRITAHKDGTPSTGCLVRNNLATVLSTDADVPKDHNIIVTRYADHFADFAAFDLRLVAASPAVDAGSAEGAPLLDRRGAPRPQGKAVDVGAYESGSAPAVARPAPIRVSGGREAGKARLDARGRRIRSPGPRSRPVPGAYWGR